MKTIHRLVVAATVLIAPAVAGQSPDHLQPLDFLVGHCWIGTFPDGKQTDEHCFEWVFDRTFIRDKHIVRGGDPYQGESLYRWDSKRQAIVFNYWNSAGDMSIGAVEKTVDGLVFSQQIEGADGVTDLQSVWTRPSANSYHVEVKQKSGTAWKVLWAMDLKRKS